MELLKNRYIQVAIALGLGITIGTLFYPTKTIEEKIRTEVTSAYETKITELKESHAKEEATLEAEKRTVQQSLIQYTNESSTKIASLTTEVKNLKLKTKESYYKLIKPDGTIVEKRLKESDLEQTSKIVTEVRQEFSSKIANIKKMYTTAYTKQIAKVKKHFEEKLAKAKSETKTITVTKYIDRIVKINEKQGGMDLGLTNDMDVYVNTNYDIWGPIYLGLHGKVNKTRSKYQVGAGIGVRF